SHDIDWKTISSPFPHKMAATLSGLGWIGKCDLLVTPCYGSAVRFASVLTDAPLKTGTPETVSRCGDCHACVDVCPGKACSGRNWTSGGRREDIWDPRKCMEGMAAINKRLGVDTHICGMCIAACPHTKAYVRRANAA
ncbi:epoxyqueuosine reductase, partial [bacterium]|nr:epoxyqueuosine reductase [bacterium]